MSFSVDFSSVRTVKVHKQQFDAIDKKANVIMLTCIEDGRTIGFNREDNEKDKIARIERNRKWIQWGKNMVYGVFGGYYSDWYVVGYFNNREDADKYCCVYGNGNYYVKPLKDLTNERDLSNIKLKYMHEIFFC